MLDSVRSSLKAWSERHPKLCSALIFAVLYVLLQIVDREVFIPLGPAGQRFLPGLVYTMGICMALCAVYLPIQWGPRTPEFKAVRWMAPSCLAIGAGLVALAYRL